MKELGEYLKRTRISNGVSIAEAAEDLELSTSHIENIESGNVRAFKDVYNLKEQIKLYAKYLGLNPDKVVDEFNGFLFEHTSKISLDDIKAAQKKQEEKERKTRSPYTMEYKRKISFWYIVGGIGAFLLLILIIYLVVSNANKAPTQVEELKPLGRREYYYEFTY
ncbi:MAG: helix-turn-helix domain-containing protein [Bacilli bacterium]|nr:helix-turn-helix domain-containing protein [Bacilli bacterium]